MSDRRKSCGPKASPAARLSSIVNDNNNDTNDDNDNSNTKTTYNICVYKSGRTIRTLTLRSVGKIFRARVVLRAVAHADGGGGTWPVHMVCSRSRDRSIFWDAILELAELDTYV